MKAENDRCETCRFWSGHCTNVHSRYLSLSGPANARKCGEYRSQVDG